MCPALQVSPLLMCLSQPGWDDQAKCQLQLSAFCPCPTPARINPKVVGASLRQHLSTKAIIFDVSNGNPLELHCIVSANCEILTLALISHKD